MTICIALNRVAQIINFVNGASFLRQFIYPYIGYWCHCFDSPTFTSCATIELSKKYDPGMMSCCEGLPNCINGHFTLKALKWQPFTLKELLLSLTIIILYRALWGLDCPKACFSQSSSQQSITDFKQRCQLRWILYKVNSALYKYESQNVLKFRTIDKLIHIWHCHINFPFDSINHRWWAIVLLVINQKILLISQV